MTDDMDLRADRERPPEPAPDRTVAVLLGISAFVLLAVLLLWLWSTRSEPPSPVAPAPQVQHPTEPPPSPKVSVTPQIQHPVPSVEQPLAAADVPGALADLLGAKAAASFLQTDNFPRRFAATVDSLAREHSPPAMWPVLPTPGRFTVEERPEGTVISPENAARYTPVVLLAGTVDVPAAVRLYRRMYPLLQQAQRDLGMGDQYLNDRLFALIDLLLATPEAPEAPRVELVQVRGPVPSLQPWVRYQFVDPELEALTAGQKILVRVGPVNQRRLKAKLVELRKELSGAAATTSAPAVEPPPAAAPDRLSGPSAPR